MTDIDRLDVSAVSSAQKAFRSILFEGEERALSGDQLPAFFADLNLDQVVAAIVRNRDEYDLEPFFHSPLREVAAVEYRHEVFRDLEAAEIRATVHAFAAGMQRVRSFLTLAETQRYTYEKERWFLDAAEGYCEAVAALRDALADLDLGSRGLQAFRTYLSTYAASEPFTSVAAESRGVLEGLGHVQYTLRIKGGRVTVTSYQDERDYSIEVEETFARFRKGRPRTT